MQIKTYVKDFLTQKADKKYERLLEEKTVTFDSWIRSVEAGMEHFDMTLSGETDGLSLKNSTYATHYKGTTVRIFPYSMVGENFAFKNILEDIIIFVNGELTDRAIPLIVKKFESDPNVNIIYGDEDMADMDSSASNEYGASVFGTRQNPYFKPDWSPNEFLSHYYFCNIVALRRVAFRDVDWSIGGKGAQGLYHTLVRYIYEKESRVHKSVCHINEILIHVSDYENNSLVDEGAKNIARGLWTEDFKNGLNTENPTKVSVVIPSKDNPARLSKCITSLYDSCPASLELEVIVVDNGSKPEKKLSIENLRKTLKFAYLYTPMDFNFAKMCNLGADLSTGRFLLFMNDDVTVMEPYTLERMVCEAAYSFTGAVGAKLLYPDSTKIQHAGVVNNRIGPVHKLQFFDDSKEYYFGFNRYVKNVSAVTAAFLMVRKVVFDHVGGFDENLRVAFNDVDLCFGINEIGYFNACLNDIYLEHAESVSRGKDTDALSLERLMTEKKMLYSKHPGFMAYDPFYNKYLVSDCLVTDIAPANTYEYINSVEDIADIKFIDLSLCREDECLINNIEYAGKLSEYIYEDDTEDKLLISGFAFVSGSDNACYDKALILKSTDDAYELPFEGTLRGDVSKNCPDQINVELSGFCVRFDRSFVKPGRYQIGVLAKHSFAKEKLVSFSQRYIDI